MVMEREVHALMLLFSVDRQRGLTMLWDAAGAENVHGAIATLVILQYFGNGLQFCDILAPDNEEGGYPRQRCHEVLTRVRRKYPNSALWKLEEARVEAVDGNTVVAVEMLSRPLKTEMRFVSVGLGAGRVGVADVAQTGGGVDAV